MNSKGGKIREILSRESAEALARPYSRFDEQDKPDPSKIPEKDPFPKIPPSLLSAKHIVKYVEKTGMIAPFYIGDDDQSPLKEASYEGRIGDAAFMFRNGDNNPSKVFFSDDKKLIVPQNSIVFVECNLDFRIPEFIALRFNLQIKHVHRGLLLGTGPLVDPGYWGKLCIPLHNLTDEDYEIDRDEGLIWIEFTKTTADYGEERRASRPPLGRPFWKIENFIRKASIKNSSTQERIGIRSSIPGVVENTEAAQRRAAAAASKAEEVTKNAENMQTRFHEFQREIEKRLNNFSIVGMLAVVLGLGGLIFELQQLTSSYYSNLDGKYSTLNEKLTDLSTNVDNHIRSVGWSVADSKEGAAAISDISTTLDKLGTEIEDSRTSLSSDVESLQIELKESRGEISNLQAQLDALNTKLEQQQREAGNTGTP